MRLSVIMKIVKNSESRQLAMKECEEKVCRKKMLSKGLRIYTLTTCFSLKMTHFLIEIFKFTKCFSVSFHIISFETLASNVMFVKAN